MASKDAMPFDLLKKKLFSRLDNMGIRIKKVYEEVMALEMLRLIIDEWDFTFVNLLSKKGFVPYPI